jgi:hypothetical protein
MTIPSGKGRNGERSISIILLKEMQNTFLASLSGGILPNINQISKQTLFPRYWDEPLSLERLQWEPVVLESTPQDSSTAA